MMRKLWKYFFLCRRLSLKSTLQERVGLQMFGASKDGQKTCFHFPVADFTERMIVSGNES